LQNHQLIRIIEDFPWINFIWTQENKTSFWITKELISEVHKVHKHRKEVIVSAKPSTLHRCKELINMGIDGINCDFPLYIKSILQGRTN